jgi:hypothetical protein
VIYGGEVVSLVEDFLGTTVFVAHARRAAGGRRLHTVYGHVDPRPGLAPGSALGVGDAVGTIAAAARKSAVPPHLHITLALIGHDRGRTRYDWAALRDPNMARLLDPMPIMAVDCRRAGPARSAC